MLELLPIWKENTGNNKISRYRSKKIKIFYSLTISVRWPIDLQKIIIIMTKVHFLFLKDHANICLFSSVIMEEHEMLAIIKWY